MLCPLCQSPCRRFGFNRNGSQRHRCDACRHTVTDSSTQPRDGRRLSEDKEIMALRHLLEGNSVRSTERLLEIHRDTILDAMVRAGEDCQRLLDALLCGLPVSDVQSDEIWGFVGCKEKTRVRKNYSEDVGDAYCFTAIERHTKLFLAWHLGKRCTEDCRTFAHKLKRATSGRFQLSTDGYGPYQTHVPVVFGADVDFEILVKVYGIPEGAERRYTPSEIIGADAAAFHGRPNVDKICTSHVERSNLTIRMTIRRLTRLTNAHSKKWENHEAALALFFAYYNFCRVHSTIKQTPAMAAGLADYVWSVRELLEKAPRV